MYFHLLFFRYVKFMLKNRENRSFSKGDVFFAEFSLRQSFEKFDACDYRKVNLK